MEPLYTAHINTDYGEKTISAFAADIALFDQKIDILTTSAFQYSYAPTPGTMFKALNDMGISTLQLANQPEIDLRNLCGIWLSKTISAPDSNIKRIGCIEMLSTQRRFNEAPGQSGIFTSLSAYFHMLDIASICGINVETVAIPVLGTGSQHINIDLVLIPLINECIEFLKRNSFVKNVYFIEKNQMKAFKIAQALANSYSINNDKKTKSQMIQPITQKKAMAFISFSSKDKNIADNLCAKLEAHGIPVWYSARNLTSGDYASAIAEAIIQSTYFIVIISKNSMTSQHVLNEIDLAFKQLPDNIKFKPLRIDDQNFAPAFDYYLSRQHWMDAFLPPLELRLTEFVETF